MEREFYENDLEKLKELPNFFDFIESDVRQIFGIQGSFLILNIFNLMSVNEKYCGNLSDLYIMNISQSIVKVIAHHDNIYAFKFGNNDFIITFPNSKASELSEILVEIKLCFNSALFNENLEFVQLDSFIVEYNEEVNSIEEFYELLFVKASIKDGDKLAPKRMIKHIIGTFTKNIRETLSSFRYANNLAFTDDVSGLSNHRAGRQFVLELIKEYRSNSKGFSVMFIDGDNLKRYNKISYEAGNQMIRDLSSIILDSIRSEDKVFRWLSGDEFLVVLKGADKENCLKLAERVRESVETKTRDFIFPTTISIGIANYPSDGISLEELICKAEKANSCAKDMGRNRVIRWDASLEARIL
jgi:diguanylate cyclase (GGDEF)-like protein